MLRKITSMCTIKNQRIGLTFAIFHLLCFILFFIYVNILNSGKEQIQLLWIYWILLDFPASLVLILSFILNETSPYVIYFTHGILGTIWWYYLPTVFIVIINKFRSYP